MQLVKKYKGFDLVVSNDELYSLDSADNTRQYNHVYVDEDDRLYTNLSKHSIQLFKDGEIQNSAIVLCGSGAT